MYNAVTALLEYFKYKIPDDQNTQLHNPPFTKTISTWDQFNQSPRVHFMYCNIVSVNAHKCTCMCKGVSQTHTVRISATAVKVKVKGQGCKFVLSQYAIYTSTQHYTKLYVAYKIK